MFDILQTMIICLVVLASCTYAFKSVAPESATAVRRGIARQMVGDGLPRWIRSMGRKWARAAAAPHCDCCPAQTDCSPERRRLGAPARHVRHVPRR